MSTPNFAQANNIISKYKKYKIKIKNVCYSVFIILCHLNKKKKSFGFILFYE